MGEIWIRPVRPVFGYCVIIPWSCVVVESVTVEIDGLDCPFGRPERGGMVGTAFLGIVVGDKKKAAFSQGHVQVHHAAGYVEHAVGGIQVVPYEVRDILYRHFYVRHACFDQQVGILQPDLRKFPGFIFYAFLGVIILDAGDQLEQECCEDEHSQPLDRAFYVLQGYLHFWMLSKRSWNWGAGAPA